MDTIYDGENLIVLVCVHSLFLPWTNAVVVASNTHVYSYTTLFLYNIILSYSHDPNVLVCMILRFSIQNPNAIIVQ